MNAFSRAYNMNRVTPLDNSSLLRRAPSIFANVAHESTSSRYTQIPTVQVVDALRAEGWMPVMADETRVRDLSRKGFAKHLVRFRHQNDIARVWNAEEKLSEIVLLNSHDGTSSYQLHAGIFRFACANGLIVADSTLEKQCVRHSGDIVGNVIEGVCSIVKDLPALEAKIDYYKQIQLTTDEQLALAKSGMALRWDDEEAPVQPERIIKINRAEDRANDLWTVFNRMQENIIRGGLQGYKRDASGRVKRTTTREVKSVSENVRLNKALWTLADEMAKLKA